MDSKNKAQLLGKYASQIGIWEAGVVKEFGKQEEF